MKSLLISFLECGCLQGETGKMSASDPNSAIYVTDSAKDIGSKVCIWCCLRFFYTTILLIANTIWIKNDGQQASTLILFSVNCSILLETGKFSQILCIFALLQYSCYIKIGAAGCLYKNDSYWTQTNADFVCLVYVLCTCQYQHLYFE